MFFSGNRFPSGFNNAFTGFTQPLAQQPQFFGTQQPTWTAPQIPSYTQRNFAPNTTWSTPTGGFPPQVRQQAQPAQTFAPQPPPPEVNIESLRAQYPMPEVSDDTQIPMPPPLPERVTGQTPDMNSQAAQAAAAAAAAYSAAAAGQQNKPQQEFSEQPEVLISEATDTIIIQEGDSTTQQQETNATNDDKDDIQPPPLQFISLRPRLTTQPSPTQQENYAGMSPHQSYKHLMEEACFTANTGQYTQALQILDYIVAHYSPVDWEWYYLKGSILNNQGNTALAQEHANTALSLTDPNSAIRVGCLASVAALQLNAQNTEQGIATAMQAIQLGASQDLDMSGTEPGDLHASLAQAYDAMTTYYTDKGDTATAQQYAESAGWQLTNAISQREANSLPSDPNMFANRGNIALQLGWNLQAQQDFQYCLLQDPNNRFAASGLAQLSSAGIGA